MVQLFLVLKKKTSIYRRVLVDESFGQECLFLFFETVSIKTLENYNFKVPDPINSLMPKLFFQTWKFRNQKLSYI